MSLAEDVARPYLARQYLAHLALQISILARQYLARQNMTLGLPPVFDALKLNKYDAAELQDSYSFFLICFATPG